MSDLEWYLDVGGKQSGPHTAKEIVEMVRGGKISASSQVTAARMNGDWVTAQDLIDAYDELYTKPVIASPIAPSSSAFTSNVTDPNYTAPPRPTEQLEKSKIITLNRDELEKTPDPTEALFQAIQAVREKANQKAGASAPTAPSRDSFGELGRPAGSRFPAPLILILTLAAIFGITVYGVIRLIGEKKADVETKAPVADTKRADPPDRGRQRPSGSLLNAQGNGTSAARTAPPVQPYRPTPPTRVTGGHRGTMDDRMAPRGGGARYRDERDDKVEDSPNVDEVEGESNRENNGDLAPVDPSQVPSDRIMPDANALPGRAINPGYDPNNSPNSGQQ